MKSFVPALLLALFALLAPDAARAQRLPALPADTGLQVALVTMGQGDQVWERFGHNALWIYDPATGEDAVYNYGVFDFNSPGYWSRFMKGDWLYMLGIDGMRRTLYVYQYFNRTVEAQWLNLTPAQKLELKSFLETNARPENRDYLYDYFRDNCSTRIRDALDRVLGGRLKAATAGQPTGTTYRWHSDRLVAEDPVVQFGLAGGLGPRADRPIDEWEEMFLPFKVRDQVREIRVPGVDGRPVPLVAREEVLFQAAGRAPEAAKPPARLPWYVLIGATLAAALAFLGIRTMHSGAARFLFSALSAFWLLFSGTGGVILLALWTMTNHRIAYANENLFQLSPLALPLVLLLPSLAYGARWAAKPAKALAAAVALSSLLGFVLQVLPGLDQVNGQIIALALPVNLALAWVARRMAAWAPERAKAAAVPARAPVAA
ncbi:MAG TPA: DUF4105 domain-containing protein [Longimicrobium sp.]|nr:DUF4105 domain-containing protein [Longimicrobium sp.]